MICTLKNPGSAWLRIVTAGMYAGVPWEMRGNCAIRTQPERIDSQQKGYIQPEWRTLLGSLLQSG